jgi:taurine dioxygenase
MDANPLLPALGVEVTDLDIEAPLSAADVEQLRRLFDERHLLLFRHPGLSVVAQVALASCFGPVVDEQRRGLGYGYVSNVVPGASVPEGALLFHSDMAFTPTPYIGLGLYAVEVPGDGAPTLFADAVSAAGSLPPAVHRRIEGRAALNLFDFTVIADHRMRADEVVPGSPRWEHPVVGPHPRTGVPVLFVNEMHTDSVVGLAPDESEEVLSEIFATLYAPDNVYEHGWTGGDLVIWDNVAVHHGRRAPGAPRTLRRVVIAERSGRDLVSDIDQRVPAR